jgi:Mrp family chromosome partitioning ATPase
MKTVGNARRFHLPPPSSAEAEEQSVIQQTEVHTEVHRFIHRLRHQLPLEQSCVISFVSPCAGAGTSTVAAYVAQALVYAVGVRILLLDSSRREDHPDMPPYFAGLEEVSQNGTTIEECIYHRNGMVPSLARVRSRRTRGIDMLRSAGDGQLWERLRKMFPITIVDNPSLDHTADALGFVAASDATILVIEAERTRAADAISAMREISAAGGRVAGAVLNKQRRYPLQILRKLGGAR